MTRTKRVLIIEDDPTLLRGLSDNFSDAGYEVEQATDGQLGLSRVLTGRPDLIVLDIMLPHLNGYDLCRRVRQAKVTSPILMLSAKGQEDDIVRGLELGADDYMTKPFGIRELLARAKRLVLNESLTQSQRVVLGSGVVDRTARTFTREGKVISLTSKEYELLDYFIEHPHRALTRRKILDHVWGRSIIVSDRSVDRCVATLRSKVELDASSPQFIHTIRDVGYRFELP